MTPLQVTKNYVELSNNGKLDLIAELIDLNATYSSENVGMHYGLEAILQMKAKFFSNLLEHHWDVLEYELIQDRIIRFRFNFIGKDQKGIEIKKSGIETVVVNLQNKIQHVEVKNI